MDKRIMNATDDLILLVVLTAAWIWVTI